MSLVTVHAYLDATSAELARAKLESEGIEAFVLDGHVAGIDWLYSSAIGGVKVKVVEADLAAARRALGLDDEQPPAGEERWPEDACPVCGSHDLRPGRRQRVAAAASLLTGLPFAWLFGRRWTCNGCGHRWVPEPDEGVPDETRAAEALVHEPQSFSLLRPALALLLVLTLLWLFVRVDERESRIEREAALRERLDRASPQAPGLR